jgi:hypothetical protein
LRSLPQLRLPRLLAMAKASAGHLKGKADFHKPEHGVHIYADNWKWGEKEHYKWREHEGRGYWNKGVWIGID